MTFENIKDIQALIARMVSAKIDAGEVVNMHWAATEILNTYSGIDGRDADFYRITARHYVADQVKRSIQKFEPRPEQADAQLVLDGFKHLQKAYPVEHDGERQLVPISMIPDEILLQRAAEYERMAESCMAHAYEIREFVRSRAPQLTGA